MTKYIIYLKTTNFLDVAAESGRKGREIIDNISYHAYHRKWVYVEPCWDGMLQIGEGRNIKSQLPEQKLLNFFKKAFISCGWCDSVGWSVVPRGEVGEDNGGERGKGFQEQL